MGDHVTMFEAIQELRHTVPRVNGWQPSIQWGHMNYSMKGVVFLQFSWTGVVGFQIPIHAVLNNGVALIDFKGMEPAILIACEQHLEKHGCIEGDKIDAQ